MRSIGGSCETRAFVDSFDPNAVDGIQFRIDGNGTANAMTYGEGRIGRGNWQTFKPCPEILAPITGLFIGPTEPHLITVERLMRRTA